jgi:hypothetical protein
METNFELPISISETKIIAKYKYYLYNLILNQEVTIIIDYFNNDGRQVYQTVRKLEGDEYNAWGSDDSYIENIVSLEVEKVKSSASSSPVVEKRYIDVPVITPVYVEVPVYVNVEVPVEVPVVTPI